MITMLRMKIKNKTIFYNIYIIIIFIITKQKQCLSKLDNVNGIPMIVYETLSVFNVAVLSRTLR